MHGTVEQPNRRPAAIAAPPRRAAPGRRLGHRRAIFAAVVAAVICAAVYRYFVPVTVESAEVRLEAMPIIVSGPGLVEAKVMMSVSARVQARILRINVDEGERVAINDIVAELDQQDIKEQLRQSHYDADAARAAVTEAERQLASASAVLANARSDYERKSELLKRGVSTQAQVDASRAAFAQAEAQQQQAQAAIERSRANQASAEAAGRIVESRLSDGTVRAPLAGVVISRSKSVGDILVPGQPILEIVDPASLIVSARFDESAMGAVAEGQAAEIRFVSLGNIIFSGRVVRLGRSVDTTTREFRADIVLDALPAHWAIGQRATARVTTMVKSAVATVPNEFIASRNGRSGVWIETSRHRAIWRDVKVGHAHEGMTEIVSGLAPGDKVVRSPRLFQYARVSA